MLWLGFQLWSLEDGSRPFFLVFWMPCTKSLCFYYIGHGYCPCTTTILHLPAHRSGRVLWLGYKLWSLEDGSRPFFLVFWMLSTKNLCFPYIGHSYCPCTTTILHLPAHRSGCVPQSMFDPGTWVTVWKLRFCNPSRTNAFCFSAIAFCDLRVTATMPP